MFLLHTDRLAFLFSLIKKKSLLCLVFTLKRNRRGELLCFQATKQHLIVINHSERRRVWPNKFMPLSVKLSHGLACPLCSSNLLNLCCIWFRPSQLVYLDKKGYRLALDSTDESNYIEAKSGVIDKTTEKLRTKSSNATESSLAKSTNDSLMNDYDETEEKSDSERDESIDYNMGWDEFIEEPKR